MLWTLKTSLWAKGRTKDKIIFMWQISEITAEIGNLFQYTDYENPTWNNLSKNKTGVINDPLGQTHSHASSGHCFLLFSFSRFEKWGRTYVRTYGQHVRKQ